MILNVARKDGGIKGILRQMDRSAPRLLAHELSPLSLRRNLPASVPETTIYTRTDGVIDWQYCITGNPSCGLRIYLHKTE
jgi:hypothetical protein